MRVRGDGLIGYGPAEAGLLIEAGEGPYQASRENVYWKISLSVPDIELACAQLADRGVAVSAPSQLGEVGYLAHFDDPQGFQIELIDHYFQGDRPERKVDATRLGGGARLNLLTLRCHDQALIEAAVGRFELTPLCVIPVPDLGFTLHFFGSPDERPPNPDLEAVENRTWVYQREHTVLEIVHRPQEAPPRLPDPPESGYGGIRIAGIGDACRDDVLRLIGGGG